jgi:hypothetical protein
MNYNKKGKIITLQDEENTIIYYINKNNLLTKMSATLVINGKKKHFNSIIDFKNMLSTWRGKNTRITDKTLTILEEYDKIALKSYRRL